jgi:drug/metabolite transporter (DMT)-like permease
MDPQFFILAFFMVVTGSINTISTKIADDTNSEGIDGTVRPFDHPFVQAVGMFLGEFLCILAFKVMVFYKQSKGEKVERVKFNPLIFVAPAICDMTATSLMYVGLTMTYASVFQMLRGAVIIFTGILSLIFLKRRLKLYHWVGMIAVLIGLAVVGLSSVLFGKKSQSAPHPLTGDIIIVCAQLVVAVQMVIEEKFISKYNVPPLQVVGWEGIFGFSILSCILVVMYYIPGHSAGNHFENTPDALVQFANSWVIILAILGNILSIAFFNFFGISITKYASATTRMVIDSIRTMVIWAVGLAFFHEDFQWLQIIGFLFLILGTILYNEVIVIPFLGRPDKKPQDEEIRQPLLQEDPTVNQ